MNKFLPLMSIVLLAACSQNTDISTDSLQNALNHTSQQRLCLPFELAIEHASPHQLNPQLGDAEIKFLKRQANGKHANQQAVKQMEILVDAQLYQQEKIEKIGEGDHAIRHYVYRLTDTGQTYFTHSSSTRPLLCVADLEVEDILFHTEPAATSHGVIVSQVHYTARPKVYSWAEELFENSPHAPLLNQSTEHKIVLAKTDKGWIPAQQLLR